VSPKKDTMGLLTFSTNVIQNGFTANNSVQPGNDPNPKRSLQPVLHRHATKPHPLTTGPSFVTCLKQNHLRSGLTI